MIKLLLVSQIVDNFGLDLELAWPADIQVHLLLVHGVLVRLDGVGEGELVLKLILLILRHQILRPRIQCRWVLVITDLWALRSTLGDHF